MPVEIIMPKFGFTLETCDIVRWLKAEGDRVRSGDPICEVTTDKVNMEVEAPEDGTLYRFLYPEGATVPVTEVIAYLLRPGEAPPADLPTAPLKVVDTSPPPVEAAVTADTVTATPVARRMAAEANLTLAEVQGTGPNRRITRRDVEAVLTRPQTIPGKVRATPAARSFARQTGIDLTTVSGSGPQGRIQQFDVANALQAVPAQPEIAEIPAAPTEMPTDAPRIVKLAGMRLAIANRLQKSYQTAPHIFFDAQIDMTGIDALRDKMKARGERLSVTSVLVKSCAWALLQHPWLNATLTGDEVALWPTANIGVAVALDEGLVVPVVRHAERRGLSDIQTTVDGLVARARSGGLQVSDMVNGTFTISNMGMYGVDRFTSIINPPQVAILAVGRAISQFVPDAEGRPVAKSLMTMTLSADHRVVDGAQVALFLKDLRAVLEDPLLLVW